MQKEKKTGGVLKGAVYAMQRCSSLIVIWRSSPAAIVNIINKRTFLLHSLIYSFLPGAAPPPLPGAPGTIFSSYNPPQLISLYILPGLKKVPRSTSRSLLITSIKSGRGSPSPRQSSSSPNIFMWLSPSSGHLMTPPLAPSRYIPTLHTSQTREEGRQGTFVFYRGWRDPLILSIPLAAGLTSHLTLLISKKLTMASSSACLMRGEG